MICVCVWLKSGIKVMQPQDVILYIYGIVTREQEEQRERRNGGMYFMSVCCALYLFLFVGTTVMHLLSIFFEIFLCTYIN